VGIPLNSSSITPVCERLNRAFAIRDASGVPFWTQSVREGLALMWHFLRGRRLGCVADWRAGLAYQAA
jgi:hypothetical protein